MPENNDLKPVKLPMKLKFDEKPSTKFINNLDAIKVELIDAPTIEQLMRYLPQFVNATWADEYYSHDDLSPSEKYKALQDVFNMKTLPTALETIGLTFRISGISMQEVTHIIRYRKASFSADCSGDKWWNEKDALVPSSIQQSNGSSPPFPYDDDQIGPHSAIADDDFHARYKQIVNMAKQLYCDMIDSRKISIMDARYILPRCLSTFYYMRMNLGDALHFIRQRIDKQIQPETDNVIAYQMFIEILKQYGSLAKGLVDIHAPSKFYISTARTGKATNLYFPDDDSDEFEYNKYDFIYQCKRDEMNGTDYNAVNRFNSYVENVEKAIDYYGGQTIVATEQ